MPSRKVTIAAGRLQSSPSASPSRSGQNAAAALTLAPLGHPMLLNGRDLVIVNPPWTLHDELKLLLPALARVLSRGAHETTRLDWLGHDAAR